MKVSLSKFYAEVTGRSNNHQTVVNALQRWGVPFDDVRRGDAVDTSHVEPARKLWEIEQAGVAQRREARTRARAPRPPRERVVAPKDRYTDYANLLASNNELLAANVRALRDVKAAAELVVERLDLLAQRTSNGGARVSSEEERRLEQLQYVRDRVSKPWPTEGDGK